MNVAALGALIADLSASLADCGIAVNVVRRSTLLNYGCYVLPSFPLGGIDPEGVVVHWVVAESCPRLRGAATAILNEAVARLLVEMGYSIRPTTSDTAVVTAPRRRPCGCLAAGRRREERR